MRWFLLSLCIILTSCVTMNKDIQVVDGVTTLSVPYQFKYSNWNEWQKLEYDINHASTRNVVLLWEGRGGWVDLGKEFIYFLRHSNKHIIIRVIGPSQSMHAIVSCYGNEFQWGGGYLMFHIRAEERYGQDRPDLSQSSKNENRYLMSMCQSKGIVNSTDIEIVNSDRELYIFSNHKAIQSDRRQK